MISLAEPSIHLGTYRRYAAAERWHLQADPCQESGSRTWVARMPDPETSTAISLPCRLVRRCATAPRSSQGSRWTGGLWQLTDHRSTDTLEAVDLTRSPEPWSGTTAKSLPVLPLSISEPSNGGLDRQGRQISMANGGGGLGRVIPGQRIYEVSTRYCNAGQSSSCSFGCNKPHPFSILPEKVDVVATFKSE
jgi:hypothetical protein